MIGRTDSCTELQYLSDPNDADTVVRSSQASAGHRVFFSTGPSCNRKYGYVLNQACPLSSSFYDYIILEWILISIQIDLTFLLILLKPLLPKQNIDYQIIILVNNSLFRLIN